MSNAKESSRYLRIGLYFDNQQEFDLVVQAAEAARRSRNSWIIQTIVRVAREELAKEKKRGKVA
jgi:uncharacterized protein (DUF1778 family)